MQNQQDPTEVQLDPTLPPHTHRILWLVVGVLLLVVVVSTCFWWQEIKKTANSEQITDNSQLISDNNSQASTSDWKTYTNTEYEFEFKYPNSFYLSSPVVDGKEPESKKGLIALNGKGIITVTAYSEKFSKLDAVEVNIGNKDGYQTKVGDMGCNATRAWVDLDSASILEIAYFSECEGGGGDLDYNLFDQILSTFKFTK